MQIYLDSFGAYLSVRNGQFSVRLRSGDERLFATRLVSAILLERNGCLRVQKSVFAAPDMDRKAWGRLQQGLRQLFARHPLGAADSLYIVPLRDEHVAEIQVYGRPTVVEALQAQPLKIVL